MRNPKRIDIVLTHIPWKIFLEDNINLKKDSKVLDKLVENVTNNLDKIKKQWLEWPSLRLGQLLINEGYVPDGMKLYHVEEDNWLIENKIVSIEDIKFWTSTYDMNNTRLSEPKSKLLRELDDSHIAAIIDWFEDKDTISKINEDYLKYFKERLDEKSIKARNIS